MSRFTPIAQRRPLWRWIFGVALTLFFVVPCCTVGAIFVALWAGAKNFWQSDAWRAIAICLIAIVHGDEHGD